MAGDFVRDGFVVHDGPLVDRDDLAHVASHMSSVVTGEYETGRPPGRRFWNPGDDPTAIVKIDDAHVSDDTIFDFVTSTSIGAFAAELSGAALIQIWATQLLIKPPGGSPTGQVGWHRDDTYWRQLWLGEVFTVWIAVSDVELARGPLLYVPGSHRWPESSDGDFFSHDLEATRGAVGGSGSWQEVPAVLTAGAASAHHKMTVHGSAANTTDQPRLGFALHLRTGDSAPTPDAAAEIGARLLDTRLCPVVWRG